jgi:hypothetical protein
MAELVIAYSKVSLECEVWFGLRRRADPFIKFGRKGRVPEFEELSERGRLVRMRFEDSLRACLARKICRKELGLLTHHQFGPEETSLRPNSRNIKKLQKLLRQADCSTNPYLEWSRDELVTALFQRRVPTPWLQIMSRFACRMALEEADRHRTFRLMDLPDELRVMVYEHALLSNMPFVVNDSNKPALLSVSLQVRQEASPVFFQINEFELRVKYHDKKFGDRLGPTRLAGRELRWLNEIGPENVAKIRALSFVEKHVADIYPTHFDLSHLRASQCARVRRRDTMCEECNASTHTIVAAELESDLKAVTNPLSQWPPALMSWLQARVKRTEKNIDGLQDVMNKFAVLCGSGKDVTPTVQGIEILASAMFW